MSEPINSNAGKPQLAGGRHSPVPADPASHSWKVETDVFDYEGLKGKPLTAKRTYYTWNGSPPTEPGTEKVVSITADNPEPDKTGMTCKEIVARRSDGKFESFVLFEYRTLDPNHPEDPYRFKLSQDKLGYHEVIGWRGAERPRTQGWREIPCRLEGIERKKLGEYSKIVFTAENGKEYQFRIDRSSSPTYLAVEPPPAGAVISFRPSGEPGNWERKTPFNFYTGENAPPILEMSGNADKGNNQIEDKFGFDWVRAIPLAYDGTTPSDFILCTRHHDGSHRFQIASDRAGDPIFAFLPAGSEEAGRIAWRGAELPDDPKARRLDPPTVIPLKDGPHLQLRDDESGRIRQFNLVTLRPPEVKTLVDSHGEPVWEWERLPDQSGDWQWTRFDGAPDAGYFASCTRLLDGTFKYDIEPEPGEIYRITVAGDEPRGTYDGSAGPADFKPELVQSGHGSVFQFPNVTAPDGKPITVRALHLARF